MLQGQRDLTTVGRMLLSELAPLVNAQQGRDLSDGRRATDVRKLEAAAPARRYATAQEWHRPRRCGSARAWSASARSRSARMLITECRPTTCRSLRPVQGAAANVIVLPVLFEGPGQGGDRAGLASARSPPLHLAFLEQLTASIGIVLNSIEATMQTEGLLKQSQQLAGELQSAAEGAAADQRTARAEGAAARRAQRRGRAQEPGNRAGPPRAGGEGDRAGAHLEVQVRIPGQHVARAAHAAQQHPDPRPAAHRQSGRQPDRPSRSSSPAPSTAPAPTCSI
jgi:hypothetical protein